MTEHPDADHTGDPVDLRHLDDRARTAAGGLHDHVRAHLDVDVSLAALPTGSTPRFRGRVVAMAAIVVLLVGAVAVLAQRDDDPGTRLDLDADDTALPDLEPGVLRPLGPRDGKDSIRLPLTAEPSTDLRDGDEVIVSSPGFEPGESVGIVQCAQEAADGPESRPGIDACDIGLYTSATADADGVATGTFPVRRLLTTPRSGTVDCAADSGDRCLVAMGAISDYDRSGIHPVTFATDVEPVALPTVIVTPTEGLADGDVVHVRAEGLTPNTFAGLQLCSHDPRVCWQTGEPVEVGGPSQGSWREDEAYVDIGLSVDSEGRAEGDVSVWRFLPGDEPGTYVDCAVSRCSLRMHGAETVPPAVPLQFAPGGPPPVPPALAVDPSEGLAPGEEIVVRGSGFQPGGGHHVVLCAIPTGTGEEMGYYGTCAGAGEELFVDADGSFSLTFTVPDLGTLGSTTSEECTAEGECRVTEVGAGEPIRCDDQTTSCVITTELHITEDSEPMARPPVFAAAPVPVTFR